MSENFRAMLGAVVDGGTLTRAEAEGAMGAILDGEATPAQIAGLLVALRLRSETVDELTGFVLAMRARVLPIDAPPGTIDTCGTGGDAHRTFNISTAAALLAAAAGVPVAKHGNRAVTSPSGSSDAIAELGVELEQTPERAADSLRSVGFAFLHAPGFHPGMRHAGPVRRELGIRTCFNLIGPLANPAGVRRQLMGVADPEAARRVADVLHALGTERAFVVHGQGIDELPLDGTGVLYDVSRAGVERRTVVAAELGMYAVPTATLAGGSPAENAAIIEAVFRGEGGPPRDVVVLNAGAALECAGRAESLEAGVALAGEAIDTGAVSALLERLRSRRAEPLTA